MDWDNRDLSCRDLLLRSLRHVILILVSLATAARVPHLFLRNRRELSSGEEHYHVNKCGKVSSVASAIADISHRLQNISSVFSSQQQQNWRTRSVPSVRATRYIAPGAPPRPRNARQARTHPPNDSYRREPYDTRRSHQLENKLRRHSWFGHKQIINVWSASRRNQSRRVIVTSRRRMP